MPQVRFQTPVQEALAIRFRRRRGLLRSGALRWRARLLRPLRDRAPPLPLIQSPAKTRAAEIWDRSVTAQSG